ELTVAKLEAAPDLTLSVFRISLANGDKSFPLRAEWITKEAGASALSQASLLGGRWRRLKKLERVSIFENAHALPRAWLAAKVLTLNENQILRVVRTGELPDGSVWQPLELALV